MWPMIQQLNDIVPQLFTRRFLSPIGGSGRTDTAICHLQQLHGGPGPRCRVASLGCLAEKRTEFCETAVRVVGI